MRDAWDNNATIDDFVNGPQLTVTTRTGVEWDSLSGIQKKAEDQREQIAIDSEAVVDETRRNLIPLSRQYMTLAEAQADIANIPEGSVTYYRSPDDTALAIEVINNSGALA
ncbi:SGNH/GDSL hydrolase family protein, partial [Klebsiella aerogenes]